MNDGMPLRVPLQHGITIGVLNEFSAFALALHATERVENVTRAFVYLTRCH